MLLWAPVAFRSWLGVEGSGFEFRVSSLAWGKRRVWIMNIIVFCRVFGTAFAELPFVATRDGYRRDGNLTRLMKATYWPKPCIPTLTCMLQSPQEVH